MIRIDNSLGFRIDNCLDDVSMIILFRIDYYTSKILDIINDSY